LALGLIAGQPLGLGMGELGESTAEGEPNCAADCGSAMAVAAGSGATVTLVVADEGLRFCGVSPGAGAATGLDCARAGPPASATKTIAVRILFISASPSTQAA
jgi:hypothetical protein